MKLNLRKPYKLKEEKVVSEILLKKNNNVKLARVLLLFNTPIKKYPNFGVWCYLIYSDTGVIVFDTGPKYKTSVPFVRMRRHFRENNNVDIILQTLDKYFPGKTIREILLSHYHFDHSETAPELQQRVYEEYGNIPPIRLHINDYYQRKFMRLYRDSLGKLYKKAGYDNWSIGKFVEDNEVIDGTNFVVKHLPGHTTGTIGLVNDKDKVVICGWWAQEVDNKLIKIMMKFLDEDLQELKNSSKKVQFEDYKYYYYHPKYWAET